LDHFNVVAAGVLLNPEAPRPQDATEVPASASCVPSDESLRMRLPWGCWQALSGDLASELGIVAPFSIRGGFIGVLECAQM